MNLHPFEDADRIELLEATIECDPYRTWNIEICSSSRRSFMILTSKLDVGNTGCHRGLDNVNGK